MLSAIPIRAATRQITAEDSVRFALTCRVGPYHPLFEVRFRELCACRELYVASFASVSKLVISHTLWLARCLPYKTCTVQQSRASITCPICGACSTSIRNSDTCATMTQFQPNRRTNLKTLEAHCMSLHAQPSNVANQNDAQKSQGIRHVHHNKATPINEQPQLCVLDCQRGQQWQLHLR